jgi:hypothetical protein
MRNWRSKAICGLTLVAFLVADGLALARTLRQTCRCHACPESASSEAGPACCDDCELSKETAVLQESAAFFGDQAKDVLRPSCPCRNHPSPTCPCPGGCSYCSVAKVLCASHAIDLSASAAPFQWNWLDLANCYSSPYHASCTPPPRV